jgi:hypothetical protein
MQLMGTLKEARGKEGVNWKKLGDEERVANLIEGNGPNAIKHFNQFKNLE